MVAASSHFKQTLGTPPNNSFFFFFFFFLLLPSIPDWGMRDDGLNSGDMTIMGPKRKKKKKRQLVVVYTTMKKR